MINAAFSLIIIIIVGSVLGRLIKLAQFGLDKTMEVIGCEYTGNSKRSK